MRCLLYPGRAKMKKVQPIHFLVFFQFDVGQGKNNISAIWLIYEYVVIAFAEKECNKACR